MIKNSLSQKGFIVPILVGVIALLVVGGGVYVYNNKKVEAPLVVSDKQVDEVKKEGEVKKVETPTSNIYKDTQLKKFTKENYSFYAPKEWIESSVILSGGNSSGCELYSINYGGDGHGTGGSIKVYTKSCFVSLKLPSESIKQNTEKTDYNIVAMYDSLTGTTPLEESKTKEVYKKVVETFTVNKTMSIKLYFPNEIKNPGSYDCSLVYPVTRTIPYTQSVANVSLAELIKGPTPEEKKLGFGNVLPIETKVKSIKIADGIVSVDFNEYIEHGFTSCSGAARMSSIISTLKQFPTVKDIKFSVEGNSNPDQILQP